MKSIQLTKLLPSIKVIELMEFIELIELTALIGLIRINHNQLQSFTVQSHQLH